MFSVTKLFLATAGFLVLIYTLKPALADWVVDTNPPTCSIIFNPTSPQPAGVPVTVTVSASDTASGISSITLKLNGTIVSTSSTSPLTYTWESPTESTHTFTILATDRVGNTNPTTTPCITAVYVINPAINAWMRVSGDVHSNSRINASGGP